MKRLVIGGNFSGKYKYLTQLGYKEEQISDCEKDDFQNIFEKKVIYKLNHLIKRLLEEEIEPYEYILEKIFKSEVETIVCDEVGCGIVPIDKGERYYREVVGRIYLEIAKEVDIVDRAYCGTVSRIKG